MPDGTTPETRTPDDGPDGRPSGEERIELLREAVTMALYISLSLLAVLLAVPTDTAESRPQLALLVGLTAVGLMLAHQVAFRMSSRFVNRGVLDDSSLHLLGAQMVGGLAVVVLAVLPVLAFGANGLRWSALLLTLVVAAVGYLTSRSAGAGVARSLLYVGVVVAVVILVLAVKSLAGH